MSYFCDRDPGKEPEIDERPVVVAAPATYDGIGRALRQAYSERQGSVQREFERLLSLLR